jgi:UDP-glucuronate decarboxylase
VRRIIALENFLTGNKEWLEKLASENPVVSLHTCNVITDDLSAIPFSDEANFVIHMASIASPTFYRKYPIETLDANIMGLRKLLEQYKDKAIKGFLFFSSSEVYGDPLPDFIPTKEEYRGNVSTIGPRACYDEAKRLGETMCYLFAEQYELPTRIARPFNNYGPGMSIYDRRLPADFAQAVLTGKDLVIHSDGTPTRTFCYISDAITGYLKVMLHDHFDVFNIGMDKPELSVSTFATIFQEKGKELLNYNGTISFEKANDKAYLIDNPNRRCPDISKARTLLSYNPTVTVEEGISRYLNFLAREHRQHAEKENNFSKQHVL